MGWDQTKWDTGKFPKASDLEADPILKNRPIVLARVDVHAYWVSPTVLTLLGDLPIEVPGGLIVRDEEDGSKPTGVFLDNAMDLVLKVIPPWTDNDRLDYLRATVQEMLKWGMTRVHDASSELADLEFFKKLDKRGLLPIRIYAMVACNPRDSFCGDGVERYDGKMLSIRSVKLFADGALGSWGAAMIEDYSDRPGERGILRSDPAVFEPLIRKWIEKGFQVNSHAIGDYANQVIMDAYERVLEPSLNETNPNENLRLRIEHAQILAPTDIDRMANLGVIASVQPTHATSDMGYAETRIGSERLQGAYAWRTLLKRGVRLALGSDFPVEKVGVWFGFHAAVTRTREDGSSPSGPGGWIPQERLTRSEALFGFTDAYSSFQESQLGTLEIGRIADFAILDRDVMDEGVVDILSARAVATVVDGKVLYGSL